MRKGYPVKILAGILAMLTLSPLGGCGPFWVDPYIAVNDSPLNWVSIHYYSMRTKPYRRIGVEIRGSGHVEVRKGTSDLVSNDFAKRHEAREWGDIKTFRIQIEPGHARDIFQNLVNFGLLDREKTGKSSDKERFDRFIAVKANLNTNTYSDNVNIFEEDPDLAEQLLDVVREFENPAL